MAASARKNLITALLLANCLACGQHESSGFLSDHNYCNPNWEAGTADETISGETTADIPFKSGFYRASLAHRPESQTKDTDIWGVQIRVGKKGTPSAPINLEIWQEIRENDILFGSADKQDAPDGTKSVVFSSLKIQPADVPSENPTWITLPLREVLTLFTSYRQWLMFTPPSATTDVNKFVVGTAKGSMSARYDFDQLKWVTSSDTKVLARWIPCK